MRSQESMRRWRSVIRVIADYATHGASPRPYIEALIADALGTESPQHVVREVERWLAIESRARIVVELLVQEAYCRRHKLRPP